MENLNKKKARPPHPREKANFLSVLTFSWLLSIFKKGFRRNLEPDDLYESLREHRSNYLGDKFEKVWEKELLKAKKKGRSPSFLCVIVRVYLWENILYSSVLAITELGIRLVQPFFIGLLVQYFSIYNQNLPSPSGDDPTYIERYVEILTYQRSRIQRSEAFFFASGIVIISLITVFVNHHYMLGTLHQGMKIRVASCSLIYRKALRLSRTALKETTVGQIVNLLSNDVSRFDIALIFLHYLWIGPVETFIIGYFMYKVVGWSMFLGVIFLLLLVPLQDTLIVVCYFCSFLGVLYFFALKSTGYLGKQISVYRLRTAIRTDERVRLMNEIISGIQVIKMYTWEFPFVKLVAKARGKEMREIKKSAFARGLALSFVFFSPRFALFLTVIAYALSSENIISAEKIFVLASFYNMLRQTMGLFFPGAIAQLAEALISVKRIQEFMLYEENMVMVKFSKEDILANGLTPKSAPVEIKFDQVVARWDSEHAEPTLNKVTTNVKPGKLLAVIGPVGAGKSSFLQAILKELPLESGSVTVNGVISYASQEPWLFVGTIRQNILFGAEYNRHRYQKVVQVCALRRDFELLPYGDKTIVGERGVSLSGGQRARINLARAVYKEADIYLLDDPLSAVDIHVGKHLFEDCIAGFLKSKTVILVTHQLQYLSSVDHIIIFSNGAIEQEGGYQELQKTGLDFAKLLLRSDKDATKDSTQEAHSPDPVRKGSISSTVSAVSEEGKDDPREVAEENAQRGKGLKLFCAYFAAARNWCLVFFMAFWFVVTQVICSLDDYWCNKWAQDEELSINKTEEEKLETRMENVYIFSGLNVFTLFITVLRPYLFFYVCALASQNLHDNMFSNIICAPMRFFHINPSGRILNRFSKDMGSVDEILPSVMMDCLQIFLALFAIVIVVAVVCPILLVPTCIVGLLFAITWGFYIKTSVSIKNLEAITRTPVFSHLKYTLEGLTTIRAFKSQQTLIKEFDFHQDLHSSAWYLFMTSSRGFGFWLDVFCVSYIAAVTFSFLFIPSSTGADAGLAIVQAMSLTGMFQWGMRQLAELENYMTSLQRILQYTHLEKEPPLESKPHLKPPSSWPSKGEITFDKTYLKYDPEGPPVLHGISLHVSPQEKIGIVGRTGAGKSTLISALFRLAYIEGKMVIDSVETLEIGLHDLRSKISIIPQEPVLFSGTLRYNLDPFDEHPDWLLWQALEEVELKEIVEENEGLNSKISEGGTNFSVGQRQLLCLARAIIRNNKILIMDEATANVDPQTDKLIQKTIHRKFKDCTVLTIAHRLNTVMNSDRILVMDAGKITEFDHPYNLLRRPDGYLKRMVTDTGPETAKKLRGIAKKSYQIKLRKKEALKILEETGSVNSSDLSESSDFEFPSTSGENKND